MFVRFLVSITLALGLAVGVAAGAARACDCHRPVHHVVRPVVHHPARTSCHCYRPVSLRHARHSHVRVIERVRVERRETWDPGMAYRYAEADMRRGWGYGGLRPSPPHPWDTDRSGYLTWSGKAEQDGRYGDYGYDRYSSGGAAEDMPPCSRCSAPPLPAYP